MKARTGCEAVQYADQMQCARCGLAWDTDDRDPPECAPAVSRVVLTGRKGPTVLYADKQKGRAYLEALRRSLQN